MGGAGETLCSSAAGFQGLAAPWSDWPRSIWAKASTGGGGGGCCGTAGVLVPVVSLDTGFRLNGFVSARPGRKTEGTCPRVVSAPWLFALLLLGSSHGLPSSWPKGFVPVMPGRKALGTWEAFVSPNWAWFGIRGESCRLDAPSPHTLSESASESDGDHSSSRTPCMENGRAGLEPLGTASGTGFRVTMVTMPIQPQSPVRLDGGVGWLQAAAQAARGQTDGRKDALE